MSWSQSRPRWLATPSGLGTAAYVAVCLVLLGLGVARLATADSLQALGRADRVVVVGVPGLRWSDVSPDATPELYALASHAFTGSLSIKGARSFSCPKDGWVTLGAGNRAQFGVDTCQEPVLPLPSVTAADIIQTARDDPYDAAPGLLGSQVDCTDVYGPDAGLAVLGSTSVVQHHSGPRSPQAWTGSWSRCPLAIVQAPTVRTPADPSALSSADALVGSVVAATSTEPGTLLLVVGVSDAPGGQSSVHVAMAAVGRGAADGPGGVLGSPSTNRAPFVQLIDVAPTGLAALGRSAPAQMVGRPMTYSSAGADVSGRIGSLVQAERGAEAVDDYAATLLTCWLVASAIFLLVALTVILGRRGSPPTGRSARGRPLHVGGVMVAAVPAASGLATLVPWPMSSLPELTWAVAILAAVALVTLAAFAGPWRHSRYGPTLVVASFGVVVFGADVATGSTLQLDGLLGYNPICGCRFTGFGNMPFAVYGASGLIVIAAVMHGQTRRAAIWLAGLGGVTVVLLDGTPGLGSDFGGVLTLVPAILLTIMIGVGARLSVARVAAALVTGVTTVTVIAVADYQRPEQVQTHLGRFVGQVLDGTAWPVVLRKLDANLNVLTHSRVTILVPVLFGLVALLLRSPDSPGRRLLSQSSRCATAAVVGVAVVSALGSALNDSGIAVFVAAGGTTIPLLVGVCAAAPAGPRATGTEPHPATV